MEPRNATEDFLRENWLSIALGFLVLVVAVTLIYNGTHVALKKSLDCKDYADLPIRHVPVGCYKHFGIDTK